MGIWGTARGNLGAKPGGLVFSRRVDISIRCLSSPANPGNMVHDVSLRRRAFSKSWSLCLSAVARSESGRLRSRDERLKIILPLRNPCTMEAPGQLRGRCVVASCPFIYCRVSLILQRYLKITHQIPLVSHKQSLEVEVTSRSLTFTTTSNTVSWLSRTTFCSHCWGMRIRSEPFHEEVCELPKMQFIYPSRAN